MADDEAMNPVPFIQYMRPDGKKVLTHIMRPVAVAAKAKDILKAGFRFESEVLTTGHASFTISDDDEDYAVELCPNGPEVMAAVDKLVMEFDIDATVCDRDMFKDAAWEPET